MYYLLVGKSIKTIPAPLKTVSRQQYYYYYVAQYKNKCGISKPKKSIPRHLRHFLLRRRNPNRTVVFPRPTIVATEEPNNASMKTFL